MVIVVEFVMPTNGFGFKPGYSTFFIMNKTFTTNQLINFVSKVRRLGWLGYISPCAAAHSRLG